MVHLRSILFLYLVVISTQRVTTSETCDMDQNDCHGQRSVLILNDEWGTSKGGLSSMNRQIAFQAKDAGFQVYVTVLKTDDDDLDDAKEKGINLVVAKELQGLELKPNINSLTFFHKEYFPDLEKIPDLSVIIGHVPLTSEAALLIRKERFPDKKVFLFIHVIPEDIEQHKQDWTPEKMAKRETDILRSAEEADVVFSVGPRIYDHFNMKFRASDKIKNHIKYLPSPDDEFFDVEIQPPEASHPIQILTFGRVAGVGNLKGYDIVASAMSKVTEIYHHMRLPEPKWIVRGIATGQHEESKEYILKNLKSDGKYLDFKLYPYGTQDNIRRDLKQSHLVLMASRTEPFGLVGLEAMAAGIPVLVTTNSGLAKFIREEFPMESSQMIVDVGVNDLDLPSDVGTWRDRIIEVLRDKYNVRFQMAQDLKERLRQLNSVRQSRARFLFELLHSY